uniref:Polyketide synthase n=1 Tax=Myxococcus fulvus TaxID=33 RepID=T1SF57_MYXFU|nr:polyketide synthase [Myxococcus fulvus]
MSAHEKPGSSREAVASPEVAIIGMACRFPLASTYQEYWNNLISGRDCIREIPSSRWDTRRYYSPDIDQPDTSVSRWCGLVDDVERFDHKFFEISPREAKNMDPQQRLLLEETLHCIEDSGVPLAELRARKTSVFAGVMATDYHQEAVHTSVHPDSFAGTGNYVCILANRVSYAFGFQGKSFTIDAACASSLVALHEARCSLQRGESDYAIVAGVSLNLHPWKYITWSKARMLSPDGRCKTFDKDANGYVPGDGIGVLLLQRRDEGMRDRNRIYGVVKGSAVNHGGHTASMTAPRIDAQRDVILSAIESAGINARTIGYVEAHGTGTSLGDPIEVEALTRAFRCSTDDTQFAKLGSCKTNIGHLEAAAGVAGVIKVLLMMRHGQVPKTLNVTTLNPIIDFPRTPFSVALENSEWPRAESSLPRRAGVSSFGIGGANSHVVLEEHVTDEVTNPRTARSSGLAGRKHLFLLSAKSPGSFTRRVARWREWLRGTDSAREDLKDVCETTAVSSGHYPLRSGALVGTFEELGEFLDGAGAKAVSPRAPPSTLVLRHHTFTGFRSVRSLYEGNALFRGRVDALLRECKVPGLRGGLETAFRAASWPRKARPLLSCLVGHAFWASLGELGFSARELHGEKHGFIVALSLSGMVEPAEALALASGGVTAVGRVRAPDASLFDPVGRELIPSLAIRREYLEFLCGELQLSEAELEASVGRARLLFHGQRTFQRFLEEWNEALAPLRLTMERLLHDERRTSGAEAARARLLLFVAVESAFRKLSTKWSFEPRPPARDERLTELVALVADGVLSRTATLELLLSDTPEFEKLARAAQSAASTRSQGRYPLLERFARLPEQEGWIQAAVGASLGDGPAPGPLVFEWAPDGAEEGEELQALFDRTVLELWERGAPIQWERLHPVGSYRKASLPAYPFEGEAFWIRERTFQEAPVTSQARLPLSPSDPIIRDHVVGGNRLIPGALMMHLALRAVRSAGRGDGASLRNVVFHTPGIVSSAVELRAELEGDVARVFVEGLPLSQAEVAREGDVGPGAGAPSGMDALLEPHDVGALYEGLAASGFQYGESLRLLRRFESSDATCFAELSTEPLREQGEGQVPHVLDTVLQAGLLAGYVSGHLSFGRDRFVPSFVGALWLSGTLPPVIRLQVVRRPSGKSEHRFSVDVTGQDLSGRRVLELREVVYQRADGARTERSPLDWEMKVPSWKESPASMASAQDVRAVVVDSRGEHAGSFIERARRVHGRVQVVSAGGGDFTAVFETLTKSPGRVTLYVLDALGADELDEAERALQSLFLLVKAHLRLASDHEFRVLVPVRKAFVATDSDYGEGFAAAALLGLAKTAMLESPRLQVSLVDVDALDAVGMEALLREGMVEGRAEDLVVYRQGRRLVRELRALQAGQSSTASLFTGGKNYLLVGGGGGLGRALIDHLAARVSCRIFVMGRSARSSPESTEGRQCEVHSLRCDVTDRRQVEQAIQQLTADFGPLHGVLHLGGVLSDKLLLTKSWEEFQRVLAPKLAGTLFLHRATQDQPLDFFIGFSSIVSLLGNVGQADYAAGNSFLDAFMAFRARSGAPGRSLVVNWPLWEGVGMASRLTADRSVEVRHLRPIRVEAGMRAFEAVLAQGDSVQVLVQGGARPDAKKPLPAVVAQVRNVEGYLRELVAKRLGLPGPGFDETESFFTMGLDSLILQELMAELDREFSGLPPTLVFEHPNLKKLVAYFEKQGLASPVAPSEAAGPEPRVTPEESIPPEPERPAPVRGGYDIAIIGMSGRFPQARTVSDFWRNLVEGRDCITDIPTDRWDARAIQGSRTDIGARSYGRWGGFLAEVDRFDPLFFNISPKEAEEMDPQQRLFLECVWETLEDAGYAPRRRYQHKSVGLFVGTMWNEYSLLAHERGFLQGDYKGPGSLYWAIANRTSFFMDFKGPSLAVDTACSSSLAAIHLACQSLLSGDCDMAVAGGINLSIHPGKYVYLSQAKFLSSDGRCRSFGEGGDGYVPGEGVGTVLLKPLDAALADGDQIHAVIRGSASNHGGKAAGFTVPNPEQQARLIEKSMERAAVRPEDINYVECQATGTSLGDPLEIRGLQLAFGQQRGQARACPIGSVKPNIGHLEAASGIAGVIKVALAMRHQVIPRTLQEDAPNPKLELGQTPFYVVKQNQHWSVEPGHARIAAISSFGAGGSNAHLILEESPHRRSLPAAAHVSHAEPDVFVVSARDSQRLSEQVGRLHAFLATDEAKQLELGDIAHTLRVGRNAFTERLAVVASGLVELREALASSSGAGTRGDARYGELSLLAAAWQRGESVDWAPLASRRPRRIVSLPTYPFRRDRYWLDGARPSAGPPNRPPSDGELEAEGPLVGALRTKRAQAHEGLEAFEVALNSREQQGMAITGNKEENDSLLDKVQAETMDIMSRLLKVDRRDIHLTEDLREYGFDSITFTQFANELNEHFGLDLTPALFFEYATIRDFSAFLLENHGEVIRKRERAMPLAEPKREPAPSRMSTSGAVEASAPAQSPSASQAEVRGPVSAAGRPGDEGIAVIGMAGEMPQSGDLHELWQHLEAGRELVQEVPASRWDASRSRVRWGGFLKQVDGFDAAFFGVTPREAELMDPQQRLFLETVWRTLEDAGYRPSSLSGSRTGLFVGVVTSDYGALLKENGLEGEALAPTGNFHSLVANRISYHFNFHGPSEPCDTACSSSLIAIHRACEAIREGSCEQAIAGGVNLLLSPTLFVAFDSAGMLSPSGKLRAFDEGANGYVRGEGVAAVLLKPLNKAIADGDHIYGVIKGSATNHGGRAHSLTAPNPNAQADLLMTVYRKAGIAPDRVSLIEAHGSGTALGDPIEINGIKKAFETLYGEWKLPYGGPARCAIGSLKGNIGHLEAAAGIAGVAKVLLALSHKRIPPNATLTKLNPQIRLDDTPFHVVKQLQPWEARTGADGETLRVAGVSSFGFGGANAHVAIEEYVGSPEARTEAVGPHVVVLSARTRSALTEYARRLLRDSESGRLSGVPLADLAFTSQVGREPMVERLALLVSDLPELESKLRAFAETGMTGVGVFQGRAERQGARPGGMASHDSWVAERVQDGRWAELCEGWVEGRDLEWSALHRGQPRRRVSFSSYPFERKRFWCDSKLFSRPTAAAVTVADTVGTVELERKDKPVMKLKLKEPQATESQVREPQATVPAKSPEPRSREPEHVSQPSSPPAPGVSQGELRRKLKGLLAATLHVPQEELSETRPFAELGLDSILALEFVKCINEELGASLAAVQIFDHGDITRLAKALRDQAPRAVEPAPEPVREPVSKVVRELAPVPVPVVAPVALLDEKLPGDELLELWRSTPAPVSVPQPRRARAVEVASQDIAVIGMAAKLPGARNVDEYWRNLKAGVSSIREVPSDRWDASRAGHRCKWGGFLDEVDAFDPLFFNISPSEAALMDPQQRLFLETSWTALEDAGYSAERLDGERCGVYVGVLNNDYYELLCGDARAARQAQSMTGNANSILAARIAYFLNLKGPAMQVDTACSSSLVAVHLARQSLVNDEADMMLVGGVTLYLAETSYARMSEAGMLSPTGQCHTFDQRADGFVPGEGVGAVVLKRLDKALKDGDRIYGVIKGTATNQDGKTNGITAPSAQSQTALQVALYRRFGIDPETLTYVEAHGTGTKLGDPIEVKALTDAFRAFTPRTRFCALGSVKTNIGHTSAAAGVAGLIKVLLALRHRQLPPSLNFARENGLIGFEATPFRVVTELTDWVPAPGMPRRAAISSFGFSGTNAHLVVEEYPSVPPARSSVHVRPQVVVLSARDTERLRAQARELADFIAARGELLSLDAVAWTLQSGRTAMEERLAFVASSLPEVRERLLGFLEGAGDAGLHHRRLTEGSSEADWLLEGHEGEQYMKALLSGGALEKVAKLWTMGVRLDWSRLHDQSSRRPEIVSLPTYPFARERCWFRGSEGIGAAAAGMGAGSSLLQVDLSRGLEEGGVVFKARVLAQDVLVSQHQVHGRPVFPGTGWLELATEGARLLGGGRPLRLVNVAFLQPLFASEDRDLEVLATKQGGTYRLVLQSRDSDGAKLTHASGDLLPDEEGGPVSRLVLSELRARCQQPVAVDALHARAQALGLFYGPRFQGLKACWAGQEEALVDLELPPETANELARRPFHPILLDCVLRSILVHGLGGMAGARTSALVPFTIGAVRLLKPLPSKGVAYARRQGTGAASYQVVLLDDAGDTRAVFDEVVPRPLADPLEGFLFAPRWLERPRTDPSGDASAMSARTGVVLYRPHDAEEHALAEELVAEHARRGEDVRSVPLRDDQVPGELWEGHRSASPGVIYFLSAGGGAQRSRSQGPARLHDVRAAQEQQLQMLFRLVKSLVSHGFAARSLELKVVTRDAHRALGDEKVRPMASAVSGFVRSMSREFLRWNVVRVDVGGQEPASPTMARAIIDEQARAHEAEVALREGRRYEQVLERLVLPSAPGATPFKQRGVYFIVGGLGGLGFELSKSLAETVHARLVLVGRRPADARMQEQLRELEGLGAEVLYQVADVSDLARMQDAYGQARARFGSVDGVVHSAIVLKDAILANMTEPVLEEVLGPKVTGTVALFEVFRGVPLDFMLFFSSAESFICEAGQSNYAAASRFEDSQASLARGDTGFPVVVINWGYWGSVGIVATERYRRELAKRGVQSIEPAEGLEIIRRVLAQRERLGQVVVLKGDVSLLGTLHLHAGGRQELLPADRAAIPLDPLPAVSADLRKLRDLEGAFERIDVLSQDLLLGAFQRMGVFQSAGERATLSELSARLEVVDTHRKLFQALLGILERGRILEREGRSFITTPRVEAARAGASRGASEQARLVQEFPELEPHVRLLRTCVQSYPEVLSGRIDSTEVMFPGGSTSLVEGVYRGSALSDYFNHLSAEAVRTQVERRLALDASATVTVLEVGAGTGGTSEFVLSRLKGLGGRVRYLYTDISQAFVRHGATRYGAQHPFAEFVTFDVETPVDQQAVPAGSVDIVLGANVLHATRDIRRTVANIKRLLKAHGLLLVNDTTAVQGYVTMTFGLMKGWWRFDDPAARLEGAPLLDAGQWLSVLQGGGFEPVRALGSPVAGPEVSRQCLLLAVSNGLTQVDGDVVAPWTPPRLESPNTPPRTQFPVAAPGALQARVLDYVRTVFSEVLGIAKERLPEDAPLERFGVDSLVNLRIVRRFEDDLGQQPSTLLFENMTLLKLTEHFVTAHPEALGRLFGGVERPAEPEAPLAPPPLESAPRSQPRASSLLESAEGDVAIIGCSGRYPQAENVEAFWENLREGRDCIGPVPSERWNPEGQGSDVYSRSGGFITDADKFDYGFFNIVPEDANALDPQARIFLETAWHALEDGGQGPRALDAIERRVGIFVGAMNHDYELFSGEVHGKGGFTRAQSAPWAISNRVSYHLDLHGPSLMVDTACSSSLTALHLAVESLRRGECRLAIAGGVNLILHPLHYKRLCGVNMLSHGDRNKTFGEGADGFVDGEGVGAVLLKPLREAIRDQDFIYAVIKATAVNSGGKTSGFTVPNLNAQAEVVATALQRSGIPAHTLSYVEAHGTGTALGDPIEVAALTKAFRTQTSDVGFCALGSVKSNIGHLESAAGIAGLTKVILQLKERTLVPTLHADVLNPKIAFDSSPFRVQQRLAPWVLPSNAGPSAKRRAGLSSFGAGGANAHVILEEYVGDATAREGRAEVHLPEGLFVLSAKRPEALKASAARMRAFLRRRGGRLSLAEVLYTLQMGRREMSERLAVVVTSMDALIEKLEAFCEGRAAPGVFEGTASDGKREQESTRGRELREVARLWVEGVTFDWDSLYPTRPHRVPLPTYAFERRRCWFTDSATGEEARPQVQAVAAPVTVPSVMRTTVEPPSTIQGQILQIVATVMKRQLSGFDALKSLQDQGVDHLDMMTIILRLKAVFGPAFEPMTVVSGKSVAEIASTIRAFESPREEAPKAVAPDARLQVAPRVRMAAARILKVDESEVDMHVDISEYGLDSINVMFMVAKLREDFGVQLEPGDVVAHRTLASLADYVARLQAPAPAAVGDGAAENEWCA